MKYCTVLIHYLKRTNRFCEKSSMQVNIAPVLRCLADNDTTDTRLYPDICIKKERKENDPLKIQMSGKCQNKNP